jgi:SPX domain protein involved in polyphosphate accumulation
MNDLSHAVRRFNRFELKYLVTLAQAEHFRKDLLAYLVPDDNGDGAGKYALASLYYDSPDYRCYWEKVDGLRFRRKLRIRSYVAAQDLQPETPVFVEIKQRVDRVTQKRRVLLPYHSALALCNERSVAVEGAHSQDLPVLNEIAAYAWQNNLRPASIVRYQRQAFMGTHHDIGLRVTFDTDLRYQVASLHLHQTPASIPMLPPEWVVMEVKVNERIPYWLTELVAAHNLSLVRMSKYCRSLEAAGLFQARHEPRVLIPAV